MNITVIGATGMVGSKVVAEALARGHQVTAVTRSGTPVQGATALAAELSDTPTVTNLVNSADATVIAVPTDRTGGSAEPVINAHRDLIAAAPTGRLLVVGGAGSLLIDGVPLKDSPDFPAAYKSESEAFSTVLDLYRASQGLDWTLISPAPQVAPGDAAQNYTVAADSPAGDFVSSGTFAVAILDELERPAHRGQRFTVAQ
ncbi:NAD(P)-dependent oxidoreductase [Acidipropionibacterium thoenii]|uniref:NAD(P)-dependent oxidoreductase n=1 Tax=Acidipropionibacterium thoenii TaxID=1751 RepID=UPI0004268E7B|nr:NAD(P)H-binding protein [Acidipropionibacterium thoenii]